MPVKPRKDTETSEAATSVMGSPCMNFGMSQDSEVHAGAANMTIASMKPRPAPTELNIDCAKP